MTTPTIKRGRRKSAFARRVLARMDEQGIESARELDQRSGVPAESLRNLFSGKTRSMCDANVRQLARALQTSEAWLRGEGA